jgi:TonB-dependent SusC/RagA subfamily outer membrane receptor
MRPILLVLLVPLATAGCDGKPVTGPEAQRVVAQAKDRHVTLVLGALVLVDGVRLASDKSLQELDPTTVERVEVLKGDAARRLYGSEGERGVIVITTKRGAATRPPSR